ncbi:MAG TPA: class I SAM-dependent methyltransferase [Marmoricola sp.]|nr:class I SAM-dependent methyltransferase [Marmoricola sp.]
MKQNLRRLPGWHSLVLARQLVAGGEPRQNAVARILRPDNLFQPQGTTAYGRYAEELEAAKDALATSTPDILSFGCSSGEELLTLRAHFPTARIRGLDVNPVAVRAARKLVHGAGEDATISVAKAGDASGEPAEAYDLVLALAVFRHPSLNAAPPRCDDVLDFARFEATVAGLSACVRSGGILMLRHANFRFGDCAVAADYEPVLVGLPSANESTVTPLYDRANRRVEAATRDDGLWRKRG